MFLVKSTFAFESALTGKDSKNNEAFLFQRARNTMIQEHFSKLKSNASFLLDPDRFNYLQKLLAENFKGLKGLDNKGAIGRSLAPYFKEMTSDGNKKSVILHKDTTIKPGVFEADIRNIGSKENLLDLFNKHNILKNDSPAAMVEQLYDTLKPYFEMLRADSCEFETLFWYMLSIDTAIETAKTGMVNY